MHRDLWLQICSTWRTHLTSGFEPWDTCLCFGMCHLKRKDWVSLHTYHSWIILNLIWREAMGCESQAEHWCTLKHSRKLQGWTDFKTRPLLGIFYLVGLSSCIFSMSVILSQYQICPHWKGCWRADSVVKTSLPAQRGLICQLPKSIFPFSSHSSPEALLLSSVQKQPNHKETGNTYSTTRFEQKVDISLYTPVQGRTTSVFVSRSINWRSLVPPLESASNFHEDVACTLCHGWHTQMQVSSHENDARTVFKMQWKCYMKLYHLPFL